MPVLSNAVGNSSGPIHFPRWVHFLPSFLRSLLAGSCEQVLLACLLALFATFREHTKQNTFLKLQPSFVCVWPSFLNGGCYFQSSLEFQLHGTLLEMHLVPAGRVCFLSLNGGSRVVFACHFQFELIEFNKNLTFLVILCMDELNMTPLQIPTCNGFRWFQSGAGFGPSTVLLLQVFIPELWPGCFQLGFAEASLHHARRCPRSYDPGGFLAFGWFAVGFRLRSATVLGRSEESHLTCLCGVASPP